MRGRKRKFFLKIPNVIKSIIVLYLKYVINFTNSLNKPVRLTFDGYISESSVVVLSTQISRISEGPL